MGLPPQLATGRSHEHSSHVGQSRPRGLEGSDVEAESRSGRDLGSWAAGQVTEVAREWLQQLATAERFDKEELSLWIQLQPERRSIVGKLQIENPHAKVQPREHPQETARQLTLESKWLDRDV